MKNDRWEVIEELFHAARELEGDDRTNFLDRQCGGDGEMRRQVDALLAHGDNADVFLETPALVIGTQKVGADRPALNAGQKLGIYTIISRLGSGGMGEVYRARDATLRREVAIKVLPTIFTSDPERLRRFEREARVLASLNHPNIAAIYSIGEANGSRFLVLELVEGETLAERIRRGALPIDEALHIAKNICEALEAAHEQGVVHRDLKPANVKITPEGTVKVLDFGLAKAMENGPASQKLSPSPTTSMTDAQAGMILGTAAYMSPEQARGLNTDQRTDIFSFGAVLYEMLTGCQGFTGDSVSDVLSSILAREPNLGLIPPNVNPKISALLRRSLEKNPKRRWHAIGDLRVELETMLADPLGALAEEQRAAVPKPLWKRAIPVFATVVLTAAITTAGTWYLRPAPPMPVLRFSLDLADGLQFTNAGRSLVAISKDGAQLVYVADRRLYHKVMSESETRPIPGTENWKGVLSPTFSPDGRFLAFWAVGDRTLKKIALSGGTAETICPADPPFGISWGEDGIAFGQGSKGIMRVSKNGGTPELLVSVKPGELADGPQVLPGGKAILYTVATGATADSWVNSQIVVQALQSGSERKTIIQGGSDGRYVSTGHIVYAIRGVLFAVPFDLRRPEVASGRVPVIEGVQRANATGTAQFSVSSTGTLIYIPGPVGPEMTLAKLDRKGGLEPLTLSSKNYGPPRASADGRSIVFSTEDGKDSNVWIYDLAGLSQPMQLTFGSANRYPVWSPSGEWVAFQSDREGDLGIFRQRSNGKGDAVRITKPEEGVEHIPDSWSVDGRTLSYTAVKGDEAKLWVYSFQDSKATIFAEKAGSFIGRSAFSQDGHLLAYQSNETGNGNEIFVQPFPSTGDRYPLIEGAHPVWSRDPDSLELFYNSGNGRFLVVKIATRPKFSHEDPTLLPDGLISRNPLSDPRFWDVLDRNHIIGVPWPGRTSIGTPGSPQIQVVINWLEELKQRVPLK